MMRKQIEVNLKVVLLHDWLTGFRGAERVLEVFCEMFPDAPLYTLVYKEGSASPLIERRKIKSSFLNRLPSAHDNTLQYLPLFPLAAQSLHIEEDCDLVISSSSGVIKGVKKPEGAKHLSYVHSPMRYIYEQFENYFGKDAPLWHRLAAKASRSYLRRWDLASSKNVDVMLANSHFVQKRIEKFYQREAKVVHPFVDLSDFREIQNLKTKKQNYYLMVGALDPSKRVSLAVEAFNELERPLKIVGVGPQERSLREIALPHIEFLGNLPREKVVELMSKAKGFVFPGVEDFGIAPLEALAAGTPVIARKLGGVLETLNDDVAQFFAGDSKRELIKAVLEFEERDFEFSHLFQRAEEFSKESFRKKIQAEIENLLSRKV